MFGRIEVTPRNLATATVASFKLLGIRMGYILFAAVKRG